MASISTDYYFIQPLLAAQIAEVMGGSIRGVFSGYSREEMASNNFSGPFPCAFISAGTEQLGNVLDDGSGEIVTQVWDTSIGVQNRTSLTSPEHMHEEAGPLIARLRAGLAPWVVPNDNDDYLKLLRVPAPPPIYLPNARGIFTLSWGVTLSTTGA